MATNWPPTTGNYDSWPPQEISTSRMEFGNVQSMIDELKQYGFTWRNATPQEVNADFKGVQCDEGHNCNVIILISPLGRKYPAAYCNSANHRSVLVLWDVSHGTIPGGSYDLGNGSGVMI